eukprot:3203336-Pyramimonas_sp.AAC.1
MLRDAAARHPRLKDLAPGLLKRVVFRDAERTASWRQYLCVLVRAVDPRAARHRWVGAKGGHPIVRRACIIGFLPIKNDEVRVSPPEGEGNWESHSEMSK